MKRKLGLLISALALIGAVSSPNALAAGFGDIGWCSGFGGWAGGWFGPIFRIALWGLVIWGIVALIRSLTGYRPRGTAGAGGAKELLRERFARGEITRDEFKAIARDLDGKASAS